MNIKKFSLLLIALSIVVTTDSFAGRFRIGPVNQSDKMKGLQRRQLPTRNLTNAQAQQMRRSRPTLNSQRPSISRALPVRRNSMPSRPAQNP